jgi:DNA processing protein
MNVNLLTLNESSIPQRLRDIPSSPKKLYAIGDTSLLSSKYTLSVVGSRKISAYGKYATNKLVSETASYEIAIVSGLALGVDAEAHKATLESGGKTIAVLPCGLDAIYPATNRNLALKIIESGGLLLSEYPAGTPALKQHFIARNRLVSGLGDGLLVTEASRRSGTIHTANFALEQGKPVMAVPGNINSPGSEGTNNLIHTGATPVTSSEDILNVLGLEHTERKKEVFASNEKEKIILDLIQSGITSSSDLLINSGLNAQVFNQTMTMLEITKKIKPMGSGHFTIF